MIGSFLIAEDLPSSFLRVTTPGSPENETPYDRIAYTAASYPQMSPTHLGALGLLFGMRPKSAAQCRYLELGCGRGATLLALAQMFPESEFVGVDLSAKQIAGARKVASAAGLTNVRLEHRSIADVTREADGEFDYITCHGVFSWVPPDVQEKILAIAGSQLSPQGISYVSFNTLPGWSHLRGLREMLLYHTARYPDPMEKFNQARAIISFLRETSPGGAEGWRARMLADFEKLLARSEPAYFLHEYLESTNEPCYFHQFMERASRHGLQYVCEASLAANSPGNLGSNAAKVIEMLKRSVVEAEQYMDFARNTQFRSSLLCRSDCPIERKLTPDRLSRLVFRATPLPLSTPKSLIADQSAVEFEFSGGIKFSSSDPWVKAALVYLSKQEGRFLSLQAIADGAAEELAGQSVPAMRGSVQELFGPLMGRCALVGVAQAALPDPKAFVPTTSLHDQPFAPPLARAQAAARIPVLHRDLFCHPIPEDAAAVLALCDGTKSHAEIGIEFAAQVTAGKILPLAPGADGRSLDVETTVARLFKILAERGCLWECPKAEA